MKIFLFLLSLSVCFPEPSRPPGSRDKYRNFACLQREKKEGEDYSITTIKRKTPITIFAIHGGKIERGTSELAKSIAADTFNLYLFEGILPKENFKELHITSNNFDEPRALDLAASSYDCLSIHGFADKKKERICLGGLNFFLLEKVAEALSQLPEPLETDLFCKNLEGKGETNIVNRCKNRGVQLEFSSKLRLRFSVDNNRFEEITNVLREVMFQNASSSN
jgi:phage replication-related protein YjqB (UPF0714/DUF867 family)